MSMIFTKKIYAVLSAILCGASLIVQAVPVYAQTSSTVVQPPEIYVQHISLPKTTYSAGDTVTGTFILSNGRVGTNVPDIMYHVSLVGNYAANGLPGVYYDTKTFGPEFLSTQNSNKLISFSYTLPTVFSGKKLGIHISAELKSGIPFGWGDAPITVTGGTGAITVSNAFISVNKSTFGLNDGPTISQGDTASFIIQLANNTSQDVTLTPHIVIHDRSISGAIVKTDTETGFTIKAGKSTTSTSSIDILNNIAGVYLADVSFIDDKGIVRTPPLQVRYIVNGDIATITGISSSETKAVKDLAVHVTVQYAGAPYNIQTGGIVGTPGPATLDVKIYNEYDALIAHHTETLDVNSGNAKTLSLIPSQNAKALRADVTITKNNKVISEYATNLSSDYDALHTAAPAQQPAHAPSTYIIYIALVVLVLIVLVVIGVLTVRKTSQHIIGILILSILVGSALFVSSNHAHAWSYTKTEHNAIWDYYFQNFCYNSKGQPTNYNSNEVCQYPNVVGNTGYHPFTSLQPWWHKLVTAKNGNGVISAVTFAPGVTINTPSDSGTINPGTSFYVSGSVYAEGCNNSPQDIVVTVTFQGKVLTQTFSDVNGVKTQGLNHDYVNSPTQVFSIGPFIAPASSNSYSVTVDVKSYTNVPNLQGNQAARLAYSRSHTPATPSTWDTIGGETIGTQNISVKAPVPTVLLKANPTQVSYNTASSLTWSSTNATSCTSNDFTTGNKTSNSAGVSTGNLTTPTTFTITCTGPGGSTSSSATVSIKSTTYPAPTVDLQANPSSINSGQSSNLTWTSTNATSCTSQDFNVAHNAINNTQGVSTGALTVSKTYTITCTGLGGTAKDSAIVNVLPSTPTPTVNVNASPSQITSDTDTDVTVSWNSKNTTACTASSDPSSSFDGSIAVSGNQHVTIRDTTTFTVNCSGPGGDASDSATVTGVGCTDNCGGGNSVTVTLEAVSPVDQGHPTTLTFTTSNATHGCIAKSYISDPNTSVGVWDKTFSSSQTSDGPHSDISKSLNQDTWFKITCMGDNNSSATADTSVTLNQTGNTVSCQAFDASNNPITSAYVGDQVTWHMTSDKVSGDQYSWNGGGVTGDVSQSDPISYSSIGTKTTSIDDTSTDPATQVSTTTNYPCTPLRIKHKPSYKEH